MKDLLQRAEDFAEAVAQRIADGTDEYDEVRHSEAVALVRDLSRAAAELDQRVDVKADILAHLARVPSVAFNARELRVVLGNDVETAPIRCALWRAAEAGTIRRVQRGRYQALPVQGPTS